MAEYEDDGDRSLDPVIRTMLHRFKLAEDAEQENRKKFIEAQKFALGGEHQWDREVWNLRGIDNLPRDSYNQIPQFVHQITNDARMNSTQTKFIPGDDADEETAAVREDLARNIQSGSDADVAYDTAIENAVVGGWGYWRYLTEYENDKTFDQIIKLCWVPNPLVIYDDPHTIQQDRLDREWLIHTADMPIKEFNAEYKNAKSKYNELSLDSIGNTAPSWCGDNIVRVAEYWTVEKTVTKLYRKKSTDDTEAGPTIEKLPKGANEADYDSRDVIKPKVKWRKCTALEVLEEREWPGKYIPYVFVAGEEKIIDGKRVLSGLVEHMMAPQRAFNYQSNSVIHMTALAPKSPWIASARALAGLEKFWDESNVRNYAYLPYNDIDQDGQPVNPPNRTPAGSDISAGVALIQQAQQNFYNTTGIYPAALGQASNETSGKAILARQREGDVSTFHYVDNQNRGKLAGGVIMNDLITVTYDGARLATLMKEDKTVSKIKINQKYKAENGKEKQHDMTVGTYDVMITTGPSYTTKRQEAAESMAQVAQAYPPIMEVAGSDMIRNMDWPGADEIAKKLKIIEEAKFPQLAELDQENNPIPPQVQAQMQQMQQIIEQMGQELQAAQGELQNKQGELQLKSADIQVKQQDMAQKGESEQANRQIEAMKLQLQQEQIQFNREKMQFDMQMEQTRQTFEMNKLKLDARMNSTPEQAAFDPELAEEGTEPPMMAAMNALSMTLNQGLQAIAEINAQTSQAIIESNNTVAVTNMQVANAINKPRQIEILRADNGLASGAIQTPVN